MAAILKTIMLRPKLNYFIANKRLYERNEITGAFIVKKAFSDSGAEALAILKAEAADNIDSIYGKIKRQVYSRRSDALDGSSAAMDIVCRLPFFLVRFVAWVCRKLDVRGKVPQAIISSDPYYASVVFSNLGSIRLRSGYHHLTNWGTNSLFCIVGEKKWRPFFEKDGSFTMRDSVDLGITVDERLADGYYYSKSIRLLKKLLENPELLGEMVARSGAHSTDLQAPETPSDVFNRCKPYAVAWQPKADELWASEHGCAPGACAACAGCGK